MAIPYPNLPLRATQEGNRGMTAREDAIAASHYGDAMKEERDRTWDLAERLATALTHSLDHCGYEYYLHKEAREALAAWHKESGRG